MFSTKFRSISLSLRHFHSSAILEARDIKPWNVGLEGQYRRERSKKLIKVELPDFEKKRDNTRLMPDEYISKMKERGIAPPRSYKEKPIVINCTQGVLDAYVPPEGDGKQTVLSKGGVQQKTKHIKQKTSSMFALKKIRSYEDDFDLPLFTEEAEKIYIKAHELLASQATEELLDYVTVYAYPIVTFQRENKTIKWQFVKSNELPQIIQMRTHHLIEKENMFAQITVRFNTRQILAIYDRFGHLMHGSEAVVKDVLEYVVFEKNISDYNGRWKLHAKIVPDWAPEKEPIHKTFIRGAKPEPPTQEEIDAFNVESDQIKEKVSEKTATA